MLDEADEVVELDEAGSRRAAAAREERARRRRAAAQRARSLECHRVEAPARCAASAPASEVARVERLQRVADDDLLRARARLGRATVRVDDVEQLADGTAGGRAPFVRSSLPV